MKKNTLKVLSLFAGAGGMDLGFKNAGYDIVWANDVDPDSVKTYKKNIINDFMSFVFFYCVFFFYMVFTVLLCFF